MPSDEDKDLKATIERVYDEIERRKGKPRRDPPKPLRLEISRLRYRERFIGLCRERPNVVKAWIAEFQDALSHAALNPAPVFSFPLFYVSHVAKLAQEQGELDLREETVQRLLGGESFEESIMRLVQRQVAGKARHDTLKREIDVLVKENPAITLRALLATLRENAHPGGVIAEVNDDTVVWVDAKGEINDTPITALKARLHRARKILRRLKD